VLGPIVGDVILTREEIEGLMANLLVSNQPATGDTRLTEWMARNSPVLGNRYASELQKHYR
jgi:NADH dehydrogenase